MDIAAGEVVDHRVVGRASRIRYPVHDGTKLRDIVHREESLLDETAVGGPWGWLFRQCVPVDGGNAGLEHKLFSELAGCHRYHKGTGLHLGYLQERLLYIEVAGGTQVHDICATNRLLNRAYSLDIDAVDL